MNTCTGSEDLKCCANVRVSSCMRLMNNNHRTYILVAQMLILGIQNAGIKFHSKHKHIRTRTRMSMLIHEICCVFY